MINICPLHSPFKSNSRFKVCSTCDFLKPSNCNPLSTKTILIPQVLPKLSIPADKTDSHLENPLHYSVSSKCWVSVISTSRYICILRTRKTDTIHRKSYTRQDSFLHNIRNVLHGSAVYICTLNLEGRLLFTAQSGRLLFCRYSTSFSARLRQIVKN